MVIINCRGWDPLNLWDTMTIDRVSWSVKLMGICVWTPEETERKKERDRVYVCVFVKRVN